MNIDKNKDLIGISFISSATCNLNCAFCFLTKNKAYKEFDKIVRAAWKDGSYVENVYKTVKAFPADPKKITTIQLWGGETLLHIDDVTMNLEKLYSKFPNLCNWRLSTNWLIDINKFFIFLKKLNEYCPPNTEFRIQLSIDGPEGKYNDCGHAGKWDIYYKNIDTFTKLMNNTRLKNLHIILDINATLSTEVYLDNLLNPEEMITYVQGMKDFCDYIDERCISESLEFRTSAVFPGYAIPSKDTSETGRKVAEISRLWETIRPKYFPELSKFFGFYYGIGDLVGNKHIMAPNFECGELKGTITVNPDGSICECSGSYIDHMESYMKELEETGKTEELTAAKLRNHVYYNPANMTEEEREAYDWYIYNGYKNNYSTYLMFFYAIANELALSGQIPMKYIEDKELLLKHIISMSNITSCTRNNIKDSGIPYLTTPAVLRRFLNGVTEIAYDNKLLEMKQMIPVGDRGDNDGR